MLLENINYLDENFALARDANLILEDGRIAYLGKDKPASYEGERIDLAGKHLAVPAFANAHCHIPMVLLRGYGEGLPLDRWLTEKVFPFEDLLTDDDAYWGSLLGIAELLASGCASFSDMYMNLPGILRAVEESGIKANLSHGTSAPGADPDFHDTGAFRGTEAMLEFVTKHPGTRITPEMSLHAEYTSNGNTARTLLAYTKEHKLRLQIHLSETEKEHEEAKARRGKTPLRYFVDLGMFEVPVILAHCVWLEDSDYELLAQLVKEGKDITLVHNPSSNLKLGSGFADLKRWQKTGVNIAIGTDGASSNNNLNMLEEITLASLLQKGVSRDPAFMGPAMTLRLASEGGYLAQGHHNAGLIKEGYHADLAIFNLDNYQTTPLYDPASNLLYAADREQLAYTIVDGEILYQHGKFTHIDIDRVKQEVTRIAKEKMAILSKQA
ncbi:MAG: amidohydrolase [Eubacteriales bacterium]|nr:amidohydrolase [Eubacteriales bacterium]